MSIEVAMPTLSPTMESGTLARWLVGVGDHVEAGATIAEVESDKASMEIEATEAGVITRFLVEEGAEGVPVGSIIALMESAAAVPKPARAPASTREIVVPPPPPAAASIVAPAATAPLAQTELANVARASPLARRLAQAGGVDLNVIKGTGPRGKIIVADLDLLREETPPPPPPAVRNDARPALHAPPALTPAAFPVATAPHRTVKLTSMRRTIARRLTEAKQSVPHFYLSMDIRMDALFAFRAELNAGAGAEGVKVSVNDFMIKALATALEATPEANVQYAGDQLLMFDRVDVSVAVAIPGGLVTPVIQDAGGKRLTRIAAEARALAERAREGKLAPEAYEGGTVSISNLGMFGVSSMVPVINPPQALILGVAAATERPWSVGGAIVSAKVLTATTSFDHRAIDGATGAAFLAKFKSLVENPVTILA